MPLTASGLYWEVIDLRAPWALPSLPIIMHHGIGTTCDIWSEWLPIVAAFHRVVRFDTRGFGRSRHCWHDRPTLESLVADVLEVASAAGEQRFHLIGESLGGTVAMATALAEPRRVAAVVASNATHRGTGVARAKTWRAELAATGMQRWADDMMPARFRPDADMPPAKRDWFATTQATSSSEAILQLGELLTGLDMSDDVRRLQAPLLVISPDDSPFISTAMAAELRDLVPGAQLLVVPGTRHGLPFSHGPLCAEAARKFLAKIA